MFCETFLDELICRFDLNDEAEDPNRIYEDDFGENIDQQIWKYWPADSESRASHLVSYKLWAADSSSETGITT